MDDMALEISNRGALDKLIPLLFCDDANLVDSVLNILLNLSFRQIDLKSTIVHAGAVPALFHLIQSNNQRLQEGSLGVLSSIAMNNEHNKVVIAQAGGLKLLLELINDDGVGVKLKENAVSTLQIISYNLESNLNLIENGGIKILIDILSKFESEVIQICVCYILQNLAQGHQEDNRAFIVGAGALSPVIRLLSSKAVKVQESALSVLGNLSIHNENKILIAKHGALPLLTSLLSSKSPVISLVRSVQCAVCSVQCAVCSVQYAVCSV